MTSADERAAATAARPPVAPPEAAELFGARLDLATRYAARLADEGVVRGLIGPREVDRLWERHVLNSAVVTELLPENVRVVDVGSGAGLPGLPIAIRRPDLHVDLVEPMRRRTDFLSEIVTELGLDSTVRVIRGRAEEAPVRKQAGAAEWLVARAVAPLDRLVKWCLPLLASGGRLLALKGSTAADEAAEHRAAVRTLGGSVVDVRRVGTAESVAATWVIVVERSASGRGAHSRRGRG